MEDDDVYRFLVPKSVLGQAQAVPAPYTGDPRALRLTLRDAQGKALLHTFGYPGRGCQLCQAKESRRKAQLTLLERVRDGQADGSELDLLPELDETLRLTSICGLGQVVLNPATSVIEHFPEDVPGASTSG